MQVILMKSKQRLCFLIFLVIFIILPYIIDGFRLRDLSAPDGDDREDENKLPRKTDLDNGAHKSRPFRRIVKIVHVEDDGDETEEDVADVEFEKIHRSDFNKPQSVFKQIVEQDSKEEDEEVERASKTLSSFSIFEYFGFGSSKFSPPAPTESNGIITWFQSFIQPKPEKLKESVKSESWITSYLNRWPFNVFMSFEKSDAKIWIPPSMPNIVEPESLKEPLTQEHFDYLLYHFPNFVLKPSDAQEIDCKNQLLIFQRQLRGNKLWTLQMLDSSAKIPFGILRGNTNQYGDFDTCTQIKTVVKVTSDTNVKVKGKYCLAHIDFKYSDDGLKLPVHLAQGRGMWKGHLGNPGHLIPRYTTINWGICVPNQCSHREVFRMLESSLKPYNSTGIHFHIQVKENDCFVEKSHTITGLFWKNSKVMFTIGFYLMMVFIVVIATAIDYWDIIKEWASRYLKISEVNSNQKEDAIEKINLQKEEEFETKDKQEYDETGNKAGNTEAENDFERITNQMIEGATIANVANEVLFSFSLKRTIPSLISSTDPEVDIVSLHALKVISTLMLYMFSKFLMLGHLSVTNRDDMVRTFSSPLSIILRTPLIYMDTLLLIGGLLSSREMCKQFEQKAKISVLKIIAGKLVRSLPTLFAVLFFQSWILPYLGSGPLWNNLVQTNAELCERNLWRNFFGVQNFINVEESCSPLTTQLALDLQLLLIGCLLVWLYYNNDDIGFGVYGVFHAISVAARFSHTNTERLSAVLFHGMNVSKFYRTANISYSSPIDRATAYLVGIGAGVLIWTSDINESNLPFAASILAWTSSVLGVLWCFWYPWNNTRINFMYDPADAATYASWAPLFLSLSLAWIIFASSLTVLPTSNIFNSKPLLFLSRIAYPMQLVIFIVVMFNTASSKEVVRFQTTDLVNFGEIVTIICVATLLAIVIDHPFQNVRKVILQSEFYVVSSHEEEDNEGDVDNVDTLYDTKVNEDKEEEEEGETVTEEEGIKNNEVILEDEAEAKNLPSIKRELSCIADENENDEESQENWRTESALELLSGSVNENVKTVETEVEKEEKEMEEEKDPKLSEEEEFDDE